MASKCNPYYTQGFNKRMAYTKFNDMRHLAFGLNLILSKLCVPIESFVILKPIANTTKYELFFNTR